MGHGCHDCGVPNGCECNDKLWSHKKEEKETLPLDMPVLVKRMEAYHLLASYAQDLVAMWPNITFRTLGKATAKVADLKEALKLLE